MTNLPYINKPNRFQHYFFAPICFQPWPHVYVNICKFFLDNKYTHTLRKAVSEPYKLFGENMLSIWKNCITCLKCSRASFSPSSYSDKMRWERGCLITCPTFSSEVYTVFRKVLMPVLQTEQCSNTINIFLKFDTFV